MNKNAIALVFAVLSVVLMKVDTSHAYAGTESADETTNKRALTAELVDENDPELQNLSEDEVLNVEIFDDSSELAQWLDQLENDTAETVYVDEQGNEFYIDESDVASLSQGFFRRRKGPRAQGRGCSASNGQASWYGPGFNGRRTANGETFNQNALTAAHKTIKFGSIVRVTYKGKSVNVRINDAGPYSGGRVIDLSKAAAQAIGLIGAGHGKVTLEIVSCG